MLLCANSLDDTHSVASALARLSRAGDIIVLAGAMGAGKTAFAQGFGRALGINDAITSPTFTLVHSYPCPGGRLTLHHADIYRLDRTGDVDELALHELAEFGGIVLVEWGDVAAAGLGDHLEVRLSADVSDDDPAGDDQAGDDQAGGESIDDDSTHDDLVDEFGLDTRRSIELHASGPSWAGRWDRLVSELAPYRC
jgi:tRNA threonylcarbamoyladenosine biosynthesis protein TsaE